MDFTKDQINDWLAYEKVRAGGRYNMLDPQARIVAGLTKDEYLFVIEHYEELAQSANSNYNQ
jgi:hypothetical protein